MSTHCFLQISRFSVMTFLDLNCSNCSNVIKLQNLSLASEASREVVNLTWRKNPRTPVYGVKEFVCLSVCNEFRHQLSQDWGNRMGWNFWGGIFVKKCCPKNFCFLGRGPVWPGQRAKKPIHLYLISETFKTNF